MYIAISSIESLISTKFHLIHQFPSLGSADYLLLIEVPKYMLVASDKGLPHRIQARSSPASLIMLSDLTETMRFREGLHVFTFKCSRRVVLAATAATAPLIIIVCCCELLFSVWEILWLTGLENIA